MAVVVSGIVSLRTTLQLADDLALLLEMATE